MLRQILSASFSSLLNHGFPLFKAAPRDHTPFNRTDTLNEIIPRESEKPLFGLATPSLVGIYVIQDNLYKHVNPCFASTFGYKHPEEVVNRVPVSHLVSPEDRMIVTEYLYNCTGGYEQAQGVSRDPHNLGQHCLDIVHTMVIALNDEGNIALINRAGCELLGYTEQELFGRNWFSTCMPQPEGLQIHYPMFQKMAAGETEEIIHVKNRIQTKDGRLRLIDWRNAYIKNDTGQIIGTICSGHDITEQQQATEFLKLARMVYENSSEAVMVTDPSNVIVAINPKFTEITGYTEEEIIGNNPRILSSGLQSDTFYRELFRELHEKGSWQGEIINRKKNGGLYVEHMSINVVLNDDGSVFRYIAQFNDVTQKKKSEELIWKQANFDMLTDLPNRRLFHNRLEQEIKKAQRTGKQIFLVFIDLDHFKEINDTLGHSQGDRLLVDAARRINSCLRETDTVARLGGDEFTVILNDIEAPHLERVTQDIINKLSHPFDLNNADIVYISCSVGIAIFPDHARSSDELMKHADQAMYASKSAGRNRITYYNPAMEAEVKEKNYLINELHQAAATTGLEIHYQPIVDMKSGSVAKFEILLRWHHHSIGIIEPATFIPLAEEAGLLTEISIWVFREIISFIQRTEHEFGNCVQIFIHSNSQVQIEKFPVQYLKKCLDDAGLNADCIVINIPEKLLLKEPAKIKNYLSLFHDNGIKLAYDNFGSGFSALSHLKEFDIDYLEIDKSLVSNMVENETDMAMIETIILIAKKLGIKTIAEGVETVLQHDILSALGCNFAQGYFYSSPKPLDIFGNNCKHQSNAMQSPCFQARDL